MTKWMKMMNVKRREGGNAISWAWRSDAQAKVRISSPKLAAKVDLMAASQARLQRRARSMAYGGMVDTVRRCVQQIQGEAKIGRRAEGGVHRQLFAPKK